MNFFEEYDKEKQNTPENAESEVKETGVQDTEEAAEAAQPQAPAELHNIAAQIMLTRAKKAKRVAITIWCILLAFIVLVAAVLCILYFTKGRGFIKNLFDKPHTQIEIPIATHTPLENGDSYEDGRFTPSGLYKSVSSAIVSIEAFNTNNAFTAAGRGSGFLITSDGYIVTNAHVIDNADYGIKVILEDEQEYSAQLVGIDSKTDIAVVKISAADMPFVSFGDSTVLEVGETVCAIGNPAGYAGSMTTGTVSGLNRDVKTGDDQISMNCVQIDAAINPGNSGGALFNLWGEVVGITSSKLNPSAYEGIGFAITSEDAVPIIEDLIEFGYVAGRPRIGITFNMISSVMAELYGTKAGLYIVSISPDCDVANTDLQPYDIITSINGVPVESTEDVDKAIEGCVPGDTLTATVYRISLTGEETTFEISFKLESWDDVYEQENETDKE